MGSIEKVDKICRAVRELTDSDIAAVREMLEEQRAYTHPFKGERQARHNRNGEYNKRVLEQLEVLRGIIQAG